MDARNEFLNRNGSLARDSFIFFIPRKDSKSSGRAKLIILASVSHSCRASRTSVWILAVRGISEGESRHARDSLRQRKDFLVLVVRARAFPLFHV